MKASNFLKPALVLTWVAIVFAVVGCLAWANHTIAREFKSSFDMVAHTDDVLQQIEELVSLVKDVEAGVRGFALTGNAQFLQPYHAALPDIDPTFKILSELTSDNPSQKKRMEKLQPLIDQRIENAQEIVAARQDEGLEAAVARVTSESSDRSMDSIRRIADQMKTEEQRLLSLREARAAHSLRIQKAFGLLLLGVLAAASGGIFWMQWRIGRMERIVRVCAWTQTIQHGNEWLPVETFLQKRFGLTPSHGMSEAAAEKMRQELADV